MRRNLNDSRWFDADKSKMLVQNTSCLVVKTYKIRNRQDIQNIDKVMCEELRELFHNLF